MSNTQQYNAGLAALKLPNQPNGFVQIDGNGDVLGTFAQRRDTAANIAGIEDDGDGWFRCWISTVMTATPHKIQIYIANTATTYIFAGTTSQGIYIAGAQVEPGTTPGPYKQN